MTPSFELVTKTKVAAKKTHWNLTPPLLYEHIIQQNEAMMAEFGPLVIYTRQVHWKISRRTNSSYWNPQSKSYLVE